MNKKTTRCFMVPIYVEVSEGFDHETTLASVLLFMEDQCQGVFTPGDKIIDVGQVEFDWKTRTVK